MHRNSLSKLYLILLLSSTVCSVVVKKGTITNTNRILQRIARQLSLHDQTRKFNKTEKDDILNLHNNLRREECAKNMNLISWDDKLEIDAYLHAKICYWSHAHPNDLKGQGENLAASPEKSYLSMIENGWYRNEKKKFTYGPIPANKAELEAVGHYTQMVHWKTRSIGCAWRFCPSLIGQPKGDTAAWLGVCRYNIEGNQVGQYPYTKGDQCSGCAKGDKCCKGLCAKKEDECKEEWNEACPIDPSKKLIYEKSNTETGETGKSGSENGETVTDGTNNNESEENDPENDENDIDESENNGDEEEDSEGNDEPNDGSGARGMMCAPRSLMVLPLVSVVMTMVPLF